MGDGAGVQISSGNINQCQAIAIAVGKGLREAGFTNVKVEIPKYGDPGLTDITVEGAESFLDVLKASNPSIFDDPIEVATDDPFDCTPVETVTVKF